MKWRHWAILIVLVLLNYIIFSTAFTKLAEQSGPQPRPTRTLQPTFESLASKPVGWIVLPTSTHQPTREPITPAPTEAPPTAAPTETATAIENSPTPEPPTATATPVPPTATPTVAPIMHTIGSGDTLSDIAKKYGVSAEAVAEANGITTESVIVVGQQLIIPAGGQAPPVEATAAEPTQPPTPKPTKKPAPTSTPKPPPTPTAAVARFQYTHELVWDPMVAPNCSGPAIAKQSIIRDGAGNPVNGVRVEVDCYGNKFASHPSGTPGEYDPGHYDFAFGQSTPQNWTCTARVLDHNGQPVESSDVASVTFDTNDCNPHGAGHQVAILNWTKHW